jgi:hypothetical protein
MMVGLKYKGVAATAINSSTVLAIRQVMRGHGVPKLVNKAASATRPNPGVAQDQKNIPARPGTASAWFVAARDRGGSESYKYS